MANENDDLLNPAEIEALLKSASGGSPPGTGAAGGSAAGSPAHSPPASSSSQPMSSRDIDALLNDQSGTVPASGNPEALLERAAADLAAAVAPDLNSPGNRADQAAAARPFEFQAFDQGAHSDRTGDLSDLKDVELDLRIELGRTELLIEEVLKLREGSVVALDKLAGDPVDVLVNGRLIARGEVLVLNDNFCVRIAEILAPALEQKGSAMSRGALSMSAFLGLIVASAVWTGAIAPDAVQAGDSSGRDSRASDAADPDSRFIPPRSSDTAAQKAGKPVRAGQRSKASGGGWWTTLGGLVAVLALVFLAARVLKKSVPAAQKTLPPEVVQVLGRKALDYRHTVHLVRFGSRMLMIGTSQEGMTALSEITDPVEIDYLAGLCRPSEPASVASSFNQLFQRFQNPEPPRTEIPPPTVATTIAASDPETNAEEEPDSDPAILRLQERLKQSKRGDLSDRSELKSGNALPSTTLQSTPFQSTESRG